MFELYSETCIHKDGIASNRGSAKLRWMCAEVLYTPPVTAWKDRYVKYVKIYNRKFLL